MGGGGGFLPGEFFHGGFLPGGFYHGGHITGGYFPGGIFLGGIFPGGYFLGGFFPDTLFFMLHFFYVLDHTWGHVFLKFIYFDSSVRSIEHSKELFFVFCKRKFHSPSFKL